MLHKNDGGEGITQVKPGPGWAKRRESSYGEKKNVQHPADCESKKRKEVYTKIRAVVVSKGVREK